jgi:hypothetical protein
MSVKLAKMPMKAAGDLAQGRALASHVQGPVFNLHTKKKKEYVGENSHELFHPPE